MRRLIEQFYGAGHLEFFEEVLANIAHGMMTDIHLPGHFLGSEPTP